MLLISYDFVTDPVSGIAGKVMQSHNSVGTIVFARARFVYEYALYKFTFIIIIVIGRMCPPVSISILSFELTELTSDLDFCMHMGHDHRSPEIESQ